MRAITCCPTCQTQFFVSEDQLNKHNGKVRCGQCLHVFDAKSQFITLNTSTEATTIESSPTDTLITTTSDIPSSVTTSIILSPADADFLPDIEVNKNESHSPPSEQAKSVNTNNWPLIDDTLDDDDRLNLASLRYTLSEPISISDELEMSASPEDIQEFSSETANVMMDHDVPVAYININNDDDDVFEEDKNQFDIEKINALNDITKLTAIADNQTNYFDDLAGKNKTVVKPSPKSRRWPWFLGAFILSLIAIAQSIYFLRDDISIYYPNIKPYLVQACQKLNCSVNLPKQIDLIVIDDSDMKEDTNFPAVMHFSSSLFNQASFTQAYPNLELTLTDIDDKPLLRRIFKPSEYLPINSNIEQGFKAGGEIKVKLGITTQGIAVAGYRVFVTY